MRKMLKPIVTPSLFEHVFTRTYESYGYGELPSLTKKDWGMLKHFLKGMQETKWDKDQIFDLIRRMISRWGELLAGKEVTTLQFKKIVLPMRPNLRALLIAKADILSILYENKKLQEGEEEEGVGEFLPDW